MEGGWSNVNSVISELSKRDRKEEKKPPQFKVLYASPYVLQALAFNIQRKIKRLEIASLKVCTDRDFSIQFRGTEELGRMITADPRLADHLDSDVLSHLLTFLKWKASKAGQLEYVRKARQKDTMKGKIQYFSAIIITSVLSFRKGIEVKDRALPSFVRLIRSPNTNVQIKALTALIKYCHKFSESCDIIIKKGVLEFLETILTNLNSQYDLLQSGVALLVALSLKAPHLLFHKMEIVLRMLSTTIKTWHDPVLVEVCLALSSLSNRRFVPLETQVVLRLLDFLEWSRYPVLGITIHALETIGNYVRWGTDEHIKFLMDNGLLLHLPILLKHRYTSVRKEARWIISNIFATSNKSLVNAAIDGGLDDILLARVEEEETAAGGITACFLRDGKKSSMHVDTPYPSKQTGKSPANKPNQQTPNTEGTFSCKFCHRTFANKVLLDFHNKAKHIGK